MINLIPQEGHELIDREYRYRVIGTFSVLFGMVFLILGVSLIPKYLLIATQIESFNLQIEKETSKDQDNEVNIHEIAEINTLLAQLKSTKTDGPLMTTLINEIRTIAPQGVTLESFIAREEADVLKAIEVKGDAPTREILAKLARTLEESTYFKKADIPISDLAKSSDIPFTIQLELE